MLSTDLLDRHLLDALPFSAYVIDLEGRVTLVHQPALRLGHEMAIPALRGDDARDRPVWQVATGLLSQDHVERGMLLVRTGRTPVAHWQVPHGDGASRRTLLVQMTPLHDETHAVTGFVVSMTDVTSLHHGHNAAARAGTSLARNLELDRVYQEAAHHIRQALRPDVVAIATVDGADTSSPRLVYHSGGDDDARAIDRRFATAWREALDRHEPLAHRAGTAWELTVPLIGGGEPVGAISIAVDDTDSPDQLDTAQQLLVAIAAHVAAAIERTRIIARAAQRQRIQAIGEIAAGVAQELRNPIFGISSAAQLLRFRAREDPVMEKNVGRILREIERLNRLVTTLVELGRPLTLKRSAGDPDAVWDDVLEGERGRLEARAVALRRTRPNAHVSVPIDPEQLAQAFRSVLSNAVEAAPEASDISLVSTVLTGGKWRCELTNGGPPIPADILPRVFDLFVSTKPGNAGAGLAHTRRIIEAHGGVIAIESAADTGTTVSVTLSPV